MHTISIVFANISYAKDFQHRISKTHIALRSGFEMPGLDFKIRFVTPQYRNVILRISAW